MKLKSAAFLAFAVVAAPANAYVLPTFDIPGFTATMNVLNQNVRQVTALGNILQVNTQQLQTVQSMRDSIRNVNELPGQVRAIRNLDPYAIQNAVSGIAGLAGIDVSQFMKPDALGMFYGMSAGDWQSIVMSPRRAIFNTMRERAVRRIGKEVGLTDAEAGYASWVVGLPKATREHMRDRIAEDIAGFAFERLQRDMQKRQQEVIVDQVKANEMVTEAAKDGTINERMALGNMISAQGNEQAIKAASAQAKAAETTNTQLHTQVELLRKQNQILEAEARSKALSARRTEY